MPQGGVLSPLLYILYVACVFNDLDINIKNLQFADDVVIYITTNDTESARPILESALTEVVERLTSLGLDVSPDKTSYIDFNREGINPGETEIVISDKTVQSVESVKGTNHF